MQVREAGSAAAEVPLGSLRRYTQWSLAAMAALPVLLPAVELVLRDLELSVKLATGIVLVAVGIEQWRLVLAGMAGLDRRRPGVVRAAAAAAAGLALWGAFASWSAASPVWALPFGMVASGAAIGIGERARRRLVGAACGLCAVVGAIAGLADEGARQAVGLAVVGGVMVAACAWIILASIWIWDMTLRLDQARSTAAELAVLRERLRFSGELHDVQGHHLEAIALKAELAGRLVGVDDDAARRHAADAQQLARTALGETRALVQGYRRTDLATELENAVGILRAAGVTATVTGSPREIPADCSRCSARSSARRPPTCCATARRSAARSSWRARARTSSCACPTTAARARGTAIRATDRASRDCGTASPPPAGAWTRRPARARLRAVGSRPRWRITVIRLLLADDEDLIREALVALLDLEPDLTVVAQAGDGERAVALAAQHEPDLVVLDLEMPHLDGVEAARRILAHRQVPVVLLTRHARPGVLRRALAAGVRAFVPKTTPAQRLSRILRDVHAGGRYVDSEVAASALTEDAGPLTGRELELLRLVREGMSAPAIAGHVNLARGPCATTSRPHGEARRPEPHRGGPHRLRAGLDLVARATARHGSPGGQAEVRGAFGATLTRPHSGCRRSQPPIDPEATAQPRSQAVPMTQKIAPSTSIWRTADPAPGR